MLIRKFFNLDVPDAVATPSIASLMATQGRPTQEGFSTDLPSVEIPIPPKAETPASEAPANDAPSAAEATPAAVTPEAKATTEEPTAVPAPIEKPTPQVPSWQEVLRQAQPQDVLKELGYDDNTARFLQELKGADPKMVAFFQHWQENNGDVSTYLRELSTNYKDMPAEDVMRHQLRREYPKATDRQLELLFEDEVVRRYSLDSEEPEEVERGKLLLEAKSERYREQFVQEQDKFLLPKPVEKKVAEPAPDPQLAEAEQTYGQLSQRIDLAPDVKSLLQSQKVTLEDGFSYPVQNAKQVVDSFRNLVQMLVSTGQMTKENVNQFTDASIRNHVLTGIIGEDPDRFLKEYAQHVRSLGGQDVINTIENAKKPDSGVLSQSEARPANAAAAMAQYGQRV